MKEKRMIDANAPTVDAVEVIRCRDCKHLTECNHYQYTADVATVRHGHWNAINQIATGLPWKYRCNDCGCPQEYTDNYCPNCGAKMDGVDE